MCDYKVTPISQMMNYEKISVLYLGKYYVYFNGFVFCFHV
jgi:hypothetical protein